MQEESRVDTKKIYARITDIMGTERFHRVGKLTADFLFPLILLLFPLLKANQGIDLMDTGYSLGNYRFFGQSQGVWIFLTFLANGAGFLLTKLPGGGTMLGMKFYTALLVSLLALLGYRFFKTKMPPFLAFAGELAAIGLCWCPTVILYNYLTYFLFLLGAILLFRGLAGCRPGCLFLAGMVLGLNAFVRFPNNILEAGLILALWYYGALKKKALKTVARETGLCMAGYLTSFLAILAVLSLSYGIHTFGSMIAGVSGMAGSASDYTLGEMLLAIVDAYLHGAQWALYMILCILPGIPFFVIKKDFHPGIRKLIYSGCIPLLFWVLGKWGMFNFKYYQKEAALQWGAVFLLIGLFLCLWMLFTRALDDEWRLIGCIALIIQILSPLGSNNHIWPVLNNLFFLAPVIFWMIYRLVRWGRIYLDSTGKVPLFPVKAMLSGILIAFFVQALGVGCQYVFMDGETGEKRIYKVAVNRVLEGMYTNEMNAETLEELSNFMAENREEYADKKLILYGNIPGLCYYLDKPPAIYTTWADLDTNSLSLLKEGLARTAASMSASAEDGNMERPLVILSSRLAAYLSGDERAMEWWGVDRESCARDEKLKAIQGFMDENAYAQVFANEAFAVYE